MVGNDDGGGGSRDARGDAGETKGRHEDGRGGKRRVSHPSAVPAGPRLGIADEGAGRGRNAVTRFTCVSLARWH